MAKLITLPFLLLLSILYIAGTAVSIVAPQPGRRPVATSFIKSSCDATRYPALCIQCLAQYSNQIQQSPQQLAQTALSVSLDSARSTIAFVSKLRKMKGLKAREYQAVKDCLDEMSDSVDRISRSVRELGQMGRTKSRDFNWHMSNVQTWVSAALTDENTCVDGFAGRAMDGRVKTSVRVRVVKVAQVTSNALGLINQFAARYRA